MSDDEYAGLQNHLSQHPDAGALIPGTGGVSVGTLRNWEQGRRHPTGAARVLLRIAIRQPKLFADAVREDCAEMV